MTRARRAPYLRTRLWPGFQAVEPAAVDASQAAVIQGQQIGPSLTSTGSELQAIDSLTPSTIAESPRDGFSLGSGASSVTVKPVGVDGAAGNATLVGGGDAALFPNTAPSADTLLRPTADGIESFTQIRDQAAPEAFSWKVQLGPDQKLEILASGGVAIVAAGSDRASTDSSSASGASITNTASGPAPSSAATGANGNAGIQAGDGATPAPQADSPPSNPSSTSDSTSGSSTAQPPAAIPIAGATVPAPVPSDNAQDQHSAAVSNATTANADVTDGTVVAVVSTPEAVDANGASVATTLSAQGDTVTMTVAHQDQNYTYPIVADPSWSDETGGASASEDPGASDDTSDTMDMTVAGDIASGSWAGPGLALDESSPHGDGGTGAQAQAAARYVRLECQPFVNITIVNGTLIADEIKYRGGVECPPSGVRQEGSVELLNLHKHRVNGPHRCADGTRCVAKGTYRPPLRGYTYKYTVELKDNLYTGSKRVLWTPSPSNPGGFKHCIGFGTPYLHCNFKKTFQVADHRCDLSQATGGDPDPGPGQYDLYPDNSNPLATFVDAHGRRSRLYWGFVREGGPTIFRGFGYRKIVAKHGWDGTGDGSTPDENATREALAHGHEQKEGSKIRYDSHHIYNQNETRCSRRVVVGYKGHHAIITSFGRTRDEGDDAG